MSNTGNARPRSRIGATSAAVGAAAALVFAAAAAAQSFGASGAEGRSQALNAPPAVALADAEGEAAGFGAEADALQRLMAEARDGVGDPHLPFVLARLKKALADQDMIGFLDLVDPAYFAAQFATVSPPDRSPGAALGQFACEFFAICDVSKTYGFNDIVAMEVLSAARGFGASTPTEIKLELRMWDGMTLIATVFYNPETARLFSAVG